VDCWVDVLFTYHVLLSLISLNWVPISMFIQLLLSLFLSCFYDKQFNCVVDRVLFYTAEEIL
jgi:hypothetical protein